MPQVSFKDLVNQVQSGDQLASFPTDTVPALAVRPDRADLLFATKQRSADKPVILMAATIAELWPYTKGTPSERQQWQQVAERYWPGALTLVLPASAQVPAVMNPQNPTTIGLRVPNHAIARAILAQTGPLATSSANRSGQPALQTMAEIEAQLPHVLTLSPSELKALGENCLLPTTAPSGIASTVARWTATGWEILRQGQIIIDG